MLPLSLWCYSVISNKLNQNTLKRIRKVVLWQWSSSPHFPKLPVLMSLSLHNSFYFSQADSRAFGRRAGAGSDETDVRQSHGCAAELPKVSDKTRYYHSHLKANSLKGTSKSLSLKVGATFVSHILLPACLFWNKLQSGGLSISAWRFITVWKKQQFWGKRQQLTVSVDGLNVLISLAVGIICYPLSLCWQS